jgi:hypothetical protein
MVWLLLVLDSLTLSDDHSGQEVTGVLWKKERLRYSRMLFGLINAEPSWAPKKRT